MEAGWRVWELSEGEQVTERPRGRGGGEAWPQQGQGGASGPRADEGCGDRNHKARAVQGLWRTRRVSNVMESTRSFSGRKAEAASGPTWSVLVAEGWLQTGDSGSP